MKLYPVKFKPIPTERIWGGHKLKSWYDAEEIEAPIGEYWLVSGHPSATSVVGNGPLAGLTLSDLTSKYKEAYLGDSPQDRFPLLVKIIEAESDLSVQVHPEDEYAKQHENDFGKTEAWYVVAAPSSGKVVYGHSFASRNEYRQAVENKRVREFLRYKAIAPGDLVYVPSRTLHALLAGTVVIEVQQTSDVTYRVYDWDRVDGQGRPRKLHIEKAGDVLDYHGGVEPACTKSVTLGHNTCHECLVQCDYFTIEKVTLEDGSYTIHVKPGKPEILIALQASGNVRWSGGEEVLQQGESILIPSTLEQYEIAGDRGFSVLRVCY